LNKKKIVFDKSISYSLVKYCNQAQKINTESAYIVLYCQLFKYVHYNVVIIIVQSYYMYFIFVF